MNRLDTSIGDLLDERKESQETATNDCRVTGKTLKIERVQSVLDDLGQERLLGKADAMRNMLDRVDFEQLLYEDIMEALGYAKNRKPFRELAQRVPFRSSSANPMNQFRQFYLVWQGCCLPSLSRRLNGTKGTSSLSNGWS